MSCLLRRARTYACMWIISCACICWCKLLSKFLWRWACARLCVCEFSWRCPYVDTLCTRRTWTLICPASGGERVRVRVCESFCLRAYVDTSDTSCFQHSWTLICPACGGERARVRACKFSWRSLYVDATCVQESLTLMCCASGACACVWTLLAVRVFWRHWHSTCMMRDHRYVHNVCVCVCVCVWMCELACPVASMYMVVLSLHTIASKDFSRVDWDLQGSRVSSIWCWNSKSYILCVGLEYVVLKQPITSMFRCSNVCKEALLAAFCIKSATYIHISCQIRLLKKPVRGM